MASTGGFAPGSYGKSKKIVAQKADLSLEICRCKSGKTPVPCKEGPRRKPCRNRLQQSRHHAVNFFRHEKSEYPKEALL